MSGHDELLSQGPRTAPEPETAEQRSHRLRNRAIGGGAVGGGAAVAKLGAIGGLGKAILWLVAWDSGSMLWHVFGWIGVLIVLVAVGLAFAVRTRTEE